MIGYTTLVIDEPHSKSLEDQYAFTFNLYKTQITENMDSLTKDKLWELLTTKGKAKLMFGARPDGKD